MFRNYLSPPQFPPLWASEWGEDKYGLWTVLVYREVRQVFRWIPPGEFEMGSPEKEKGRYSDETQHHVKLSKGFWLADTPVTQALWQVVMGDNPSHFKGENLPVEKISWDDTQLFMQKLSEFHPDLNVHLPTEAQWEYGCRAGAEESLPFSFGRKIDLDKANYRGTWDGYGKFGKGAKEQTTPVAIYPCNEWGLYDMHGNVWEWCNDWYESYSRESVVDPAGAEEGSGRVLRGGSWIYGGRVVRSAYRGSGDPAYRVRGIGFRLCLSPGQEFRQEKEQAGGPSHPPA